MSPLAWRWSYLSPRHWGTWLLVALIRLCAVAPRRGSLAIGAVLGELFRRTNRKRRRIVDINIALCFPALDAAERELMAREHFRYYGRSVIDLGLLWWAPHARLKKLVRFVGAERYQALVTAGANVILLTPHGTCVDFGGVMVSGLHPAISMMKPLADPLLNRFVLQGRLRFPASRMVMRDAGLRPLIRALRSNIACYYIPDGDFGIEGSVFAPFFGVSTATLTTLGRMAKMTGACVVPCFTRLRPEDGTYEVTLKAPLEDFPSGDALTDAARMNAELEAGIRMAPAQYMWTLKWFRTRPAGEPSVYD